MEKKSTQIINPGPSKEIWDETLARHGIDPKNITEYNVPDGEPETEKAGDQKMLTDIQRQDKLFP